MASALVSPSHDRMVVTSPRRGSALPQHSHKSTIWLLSSASIHIHLILQLSNTSIHIHHIQQLYDFSHLFLFVLEMAIQIRKHIRLQIIHTCVDPEETSWKSGKISRKSGNISKKSGNISKKSGNISRKSGNISRKSGNISRKSVDGWVAGSGSGRGGEEIPTITITNRARYTLWTKMYNVRLPTARAVCTLCTKMYNVRLPTARAVCTLCTKMYTKSYVGLPTARSTAKLEAAPLNVWFQFCKRNKTRFLDVQLGWIRRCSIKNQNNKR